MVGPAIQTPRVKREELEAVWLERVRLARAQYEEKAAAGLMRDGVMSPGQELDGSDAVIIASMREWEALREYERVLTIFTDLVLRGIVPNERVGP